MLRNIRGKKIMFWIVSLEQFWIENGLKLVFGLGYYIVVFEYHIRTKESIDHVSQYDIQWANCFTNVLLPGT